MESILNCIRMVKIGSSYSQCCYRYRSAPASPSHMSGAFTPDSLSREGSPVPEEEMNQQQQPQGVGLPTTVAHRSQPMLPPAATDLRTSQSAPGSPSAQILQGRSLQTV